jgi:phosphonate transport system substrate-binding protein
MNPDSPTAPKTSARALIVALVCVVIAAVTGVAGGMWYSNQANSAERSPLSRSLANTERVRGSTGRLADAFADADGNLVADPPKDAGKLIDPPALGFAPVARFRSEAEAEAEAKEWQPFLDHLKKVTGKEVKFVPAFSSTKQFELMKEGEVLVACVNTGAVPAAVNTHGFVPAFVAADAKGNFGYAVELLVPASSKLRGPRDLMGRQVTLTSFRSNAGLKAPLVMLFREYQLQPGLDYDVNFSAGYDDSIRGLAAGKLEVIALPSDLREQAEKAGTLKAGSFRVLAVSKSGKFPPACYGYRYDLKPELADKVKRAFAEFNWEGTELAKKTGHAKFVPVTYKDDFAAVRQVDSTMAKLDTLDE